jgi:hypothetical protein
MLRTMSSDEGFAQTTLGGHHEHWEAPASIEQHAVSTGRVPGNAKKHLTTLGSGREQVGKSTQHVESTRHNKSFYCCSYGFTSNFEASRSCTMQCG